MYKTPFQLEDEEDGEAIKRLDEGELEPDPLTDTDPSADATDDDVEDLLGDDLSARSKGGLDFSQFADPVKAPPASSKARPSSSKALDFSSFAEKVERPAAKAAVPMPRARPSEAPQADLFDEAAIPQPRTRAPEFAAPARESFGGYAPKTPAPAVAASEPHSDNDLLGFKVRPRLHPGEDAYFKANPHVSGMAAETDDIILNPYSSPAVNKDAVARNEAFRLHLRKQGVIPDFALTPEQVEAFKDTPYAQDEAALKSTIAARIYSGDPSARATAEQKAWVKAALNGGKSAPAASPPAQPGALSRGFVSGLIEQNPDLTAEFFEGMSHLAPDGINSTMRSAADEMRKVSKMRPEDYKRKAGSMWDIGSIDDALTWVGENIGQGLASSIPSVAMSAGGAVVGGRLAGKPGAFVGAAGGAMIPSYIQNYGDVYKEFKENGVDPKRAAELSAAVAVPMAALDSWNPATIVTRFGGITEVRREVARGIVRRILAETGKGAGREGVTEAAQQAVEEAAVALETGKPLFTVERGKKVVESGVAGAMTGGVMGGPLGVKADTVVPRPNSTPEEIAEFLRAAGGNAANPTREEIDEFLRRRDAGEVFDDKTGTWSKPAPLAALPPPGKRNDNDDDGPDGGTPTPSTVGATQRRALRKVGYNDEQIDAMSASELAAELAEAGVAPAAEPAKPAAPLAPDTPGPEPYSDIAAQMVDLADPKSGRGAVFISKPTLDHLNEIGKLGELGEGALGQNAATIENFDGQGGALIARDKAVADQAVAERDAGTPTQVIIGRLTGWGDGKPIDGSQVVQDLDKNGNVIRGRLVAPGGVGAASQEFKSRGGGRNVQVTTPEKALARRNALIEQERANSLVIPGFLRRDPNAPKPDFSDQATPVTGAGTRTSPAAVTDAEDVARAEARVNTEPSEAQKEAGNYAKGHLKWNGLNVTIENPKGSLRKGKNPDGTQWQTTMPAAYGYVKRTKGKDGDQVDVYVGQHSDAHTAYIVDQYDPATGKFDEHKVMLGFADPNSAIAAYEGAFSDGSGPARRGAVTARSLNQLKAWLKDGKTTKPVGKVKTFPKPDDGNLADEDAYGSDRPGDLPGFLESIEKDISEGHYDATLAPTKSLNEFRAAAEKRGWTLAPYGKGKALWSPDRKHVMFDGVAVEGNSVQVQWGTPGEGITPPADAKPDFSAHAAPTDTGLTVSSPGFEISDKAKEIVRDRIDQVDFGDRGVANIIQLKDGTFHNARSTDIFDHAVKKDLREGIELRRKGDQVTISAYHRADGTGFGGSTISGKMVERVIRAWGKVDHTAPLPKEPKRPTAEEASKNRDETIKANIAQMRETLLAPTEIQAQDSDETVTVRLTEKGPWDFNDTFPLPDLEQVAGAAYEGRNVFEDEDGAPSVEGVVSTIGEMVSQLAGNFGAIKQINAKIAEQQKATGKAAKGADKKLKALKADLANERAEIHGAIGALQDGFTKTGTAAIVREARRMVAGESKTAEPDVGQVAPQDEGISPTAEVTEATEATEKKDRIEDAGEKIGGARKDQFAGGLQVHDLDDMNGAERDKSVTKDKVWPRLDYAQLVADGVEKEAAALIKVIYDRLPAAPSPGYGRSVGLAEQQQYVTILHTLRELVSEAKTSADVRDLKGKLNEAITGNSGRWGTDEFGAVMPKIKGRVRYQHPADIDSGDTRRADKLIALGFPNIEPWQRIFYIYEQKHGDGKPSTWFVWRNRGGKEAGPLATRDEAVSAAKAAYEKRGENQEQGAEEPKRPHLDNVRRVGPDVRKGKDVGSQDFVDDFGFRGVEFGNWVAGDERQKVVNLAYDALHDLARTMNLPPKALSLNGTLGVAFGSRGRGGKAAAHYEPSYLAINMTKLSGAGSLAHEWAHALDHYLGEVDSNNPYGGAPKSISQWRDTDVSQTTFKSRHLANLTPRLNRTANAVMQALHFKAEDDAATYDRLAALDERYQSGIKSWRDEAERVKDMLRKGGGNTRSLNARLKKAEQQIEVWEDSLARKVRNQSGAALVHTDYYREGRKLSGKSGDYWHRPNELFARAFESYVFDKLASEGDGHVSQYLVQGVEPDRFGPAYKGNPYPAGAEREAINKAFDDFARALTVAEGQRGPDTKLTGKVEEEPQPIVTDTTPVPEVTAAEKKDQLEGEMAALDEATDALESGEEKVNTNAIVAAKFAAHLRDGGEFKNILVARKMATEAGFDGDAKAVEEAMELAVVQLGREIAADPDATPRAKFTALVDLYSRQPKLGTRTSTSMRDQAFSTPIPLAFAASRLAQIDDMDVEVIYEPSAGNGALLVEANAAPDIGGKTVIANELNPQRADNLRSIAGLIKGVKADKQGFRVTENDATDPAQAKVIQQQLDGADRVIANPPFGAVRQEGESKVFDLTDIQPGYRTKEIDHAIALRALQALRDDGRAVLLLGGINKMAASKEARSDAYNSKAKREFYKTLYDLYNVTDHFTVAGELYERQGAGWPVDVVVIEGRGKSARKLPAVDVPRLLTSWDQIGALLDGDVSGRSENAPDRDAQGAGAGRTDDGNEGVRAGGERQPVTEPERVEPGSVQQRADERSGDDLAGRPGQEPARDERRLAERVGDEPPPERRPSGLEGFDQAFDNALDDTFGAQVAPKSSEPPAQKTARAKKPKGPSRLDRLENYFRPGRVVPGYFGTDEVLKFERTPDGYFEVQVREVKDGKPVGPVRTHATSPSERDLVAWERQHPVGDRTTAEVAKSAATNLAASADDAMAGLVQMFGGGKTLGAGINFDEQTYAKAKPLFEKAAGKFAAFKDDIAELVKRMVGEMQRVHGLTREALESMRPYLRRFMEDVKAGVVRLGETVKAAVTPTEKKAAPERKADRQEEETERQVAYKPQSKSQGLGTLVPVNMRTAVSESLADLEERVGPLDAYVAKHLGYETDSAGQPYFERDGETEYPFAAEQIDAIALAIDNMEKGKALIIGDQTGIGKGRVNAGILRYAMNKGLVPTFVTAKPNLYGDIYRDLHDIGIDVMLGRELRLLATNPELSVPLTEEDNPLLLRTAARTEHAKLLQGLNAEGVKADYDVVLTTYNQMQTVQGKETDRRSFLARIAPDAIFAFDESHEAGGQGKLAVKGKVMNRADFTRALIDKAQGVFYSSATYAKRPDVMDLYSATDMMMAVEKKEDLAEAIARGGVPMQQVVAAMLAKAGQYIRRERSFAGVDYNTPVAAVARQLYDGISSTLAAIQDFSKSVAGAAKAIDDDVKAEAQHVTADGSTGDAGAHSIQFTSIMHNVIAQMLLAMKADPVVNMAIDALKRGEKPVITVANTMESLLSDYAEQLDLKPGDVINATFGDVLTKYLDRTRTIIIKRPFSKEKGERRYLTDLELGADGVALYQAAKEAISRLEGVNTLPASPIDRIKNGLEAAGYKIGEITGRGTIIDYSGKEPILRHRTGKETSIRGRRETLTGFNSGKLDALLLNQAGSTGLSAHASEKYKDQRQRHMMIAQAEANIDTHMQMLGRVHRTGQVIVPKYSQLVADIPAEKRPAAVLAKKMASLNANTTASREGALSAKDVPDFMNEFGDRVAATMLNDDEVLFHRLALPDTMVGDNGGIKDEDAMRKMTGRIPLLPLAEQEELYERLEADYKALIEQMEASGENTLEAKTIDLKARPIERTLVVEPKGGSNSPFASPVYIERTSIARQGKSFSAAELMQKLLEEIEDTNQIADEEQAIRVFSGFEDAYGRKAREREIVTREAAVTEFLDYRRQTTDDMEEAKAEKERAKLNAVFDRWSALHQMLHVGARVTLKMNSGNKTAIALKTMKGKPAKNPLALSTWHAVFAVADGERQMTIPFSRLYLDGKSPADDKTAIEVATIGWIETPQQTLERFAAMQNSARYERFIATGNLLAAYDWLNRRGQIINYTDEQGHIRQGILTAKDFEIAKHAKTKAKAIRDPAKIVAWVKNNPGKFIWTEDQVARVKHDGSRFYITTEAAKKTGGIYYLDKDLTAITRDFYKSGSTMVNDIYDPTDATMTKIVTRLQELGAKFVNKDETGLPPAEKLNNPGDAEMASLGRDLATERAIERFRLTRKAEQQQREIERAVRDALRQVAGKSIAARAEVTDYIDPRGVNLNSDWGSLADDEADILGSFNPTLALVRIATGGNPDAIATAYHEGWHAIEGALTKDDLAVLRRETDRLRAYVEGKRPDLKGLLDGVEAEEIWAEAAAQYTRAKADGGSVAGIHIAVRRIFERIMDLLRKIKNSLAGLGFKSAEDVFESFAQGEMADRRGNLPESMRNRWWDKRYNGGVEMGSIGVRRRAPRAGDLEPLPETVRDAMSQAGVPLKQRLSDAFDAMMLKPSRRLWDQQIDLLRFQKAAEAMSGAIPEGLDTYLAATLYPGRAGEKMKDAVRDLFRPLYDEMKKRNITREGLNEYLYARHAKERNAEIRKIDPANDAGSGMTDAEADMVMGTYIGNSADIDAVAALVDKVVAYNRDLMLREGLESQRTIDQWEQTYSHYVPLKGFEAGFDGEIIGSPGGGTGFSVRGRESMRALGRFDKADDILANLLDQTQRTVIRAEKNRVAKTFLKFAQENDSPFWTIGLARKERRVNPITGMVEEYWSQLPANLDRVFAAKVGGKAYYIEIKHQGLLDGLKSLGLNKIHPFLALINRLTREYSRFQTAKNPEFFLTNVLRDLQDAGLTLSGEQQAKLLKRYAVNLGKGKALYGAILGITETGANKDARRWFEEWRAAGGKISHYGLKDIEEIKREIDRELNERLESTGKKVGLTVPRMLNPINGKIVKAIEAVSDVTETMTRLAVYISAREIGMTQKEAARLSRNATVDFNKSGADSNWLNALYAFAKANINGNIRLLRVLRKSKWARRTAGGIVMAGMMMTFWNMGVSGEDDDKKNAYEKRKYWERERNIIIFMPGAKDGAKIPLGYGINVFWMLGEQMAMRMLGKVSTPEMIGNVLGTAAAAFNPLGSSGSFFDIGAWARSISPTVTRWITELAQNENFLGYPIHPNEMPWTEGLPHSSRHKGSTHPAAVEIAQDVNKVTGGNKFEPGKVDLYADDLEYMWNFMVGGLGRFLANSSGTIADWMDGVERPVERIPFVRRFVVSDNSPTVVQGQYYEKRNETQQKARRLRAAIKARNEGKDDDGSADEVIERLAEETGARPGRNGKGISVPAEAQFRRADKEIKALRAVEDQIRKNDALSRADKATQIKDLRDQMREIMRGAAVAQ